MICCISALFVCCCCCCYIHGEINPFQSAILYLAFTYCCLCFNNSENTGNGFEQDEATIGNYGLPMRQPGVLVLLACLS
jgi:hypothetical protein